MTDDLRQRYAEAMLQHYLDPSQTDADGHDYCVCGGWASGEMSEGWDDHLAEVVLAVRDAEVDALRQEIELLRAAANPTKAELLGRLVSTATRLVRLERDDARAALARVREALATFDGRGVDNFDVPTPAEILDAWRASLEPAGAVSEEQTGPRAVDVPADGQQTGDRDV